MTRRATPNTPWACRNVCATIRSMEYPRCGNSQSGRLGPMTAYTRNSPERIGNANPSDRRAASMTSTSPTTPTRMSVEVSNPARLPSVELPCHTLSNSGSVCTMIHPQQTAASSASRMSLARATGCSFNVGWTGTFRKQMTSPSSANTASCDCGERIG